MEPQEAHFKLHPKMHSSRFSIPVPSICHPPSDRRAIYVISGLTGDCDCDCDSLQLGFLLLYKVRSHTIPQSQWGRHETPLLEGTLSVQRHHYFTPARLKAQSSHPRPIPMAHGNGNGRDREGQQQRQEAGRQAGTNADADAGDQETSVAAAKGQTNGINIMAKAANELQELQSINRA